MPTAYLAAEGFEAQFEAERPDARLLHGRLYISEAAHPSAWAANIWHDCVELPVESVGKAAQALRDNLRRRKAQSREAVREEAAPPPPPDTPET